VQEVNAQAVDPGAELRMGVQASLEASPVVSGAPIPDQLLHPVEGDALPPIIGRLALRPARGLQAAARVADRSTRRHDSEGRDRFRGAPRCVDGDRIGTGAWCHARYGLAPRSCISQANATPLPPPCSVRIFAISPSVDSRAQSRCHSPLRAIHVMGTTPACTNRRTAMS